LPAVPAAEESSPRACGDVTVLHAAAANGYAPMFDFLMQNGASWQHQDAYRRNPLHYAVLYDHGLCAKLVLRRGGDAHKARDARGRTPMDMVMDKGRVADEELFLLLSSM
jgi:Arf-GAP/coiled-coil/ANK repeat/PH domain-containing protein